MTNRWHLGQSAVIAFGLWLLAGCAYYSFSGSTLPNIKTIAIPLFEDNTAEIGVKEQLTNAVIQAFTSDNSLKIADRRNADSVLKGTLLSVTERAGAYNRQEQVQEIQVFIAVKVQFEDSKKRKIIWEDQINQFGSYIPGDTQRGTREIAITDAIDKTAQEVLNKTVSGW